MSETQEKTDQNEAAENDQEEDSDGSSEYETDTDTETTVQTNTLSSAKPQSTQANPQMQQTQGIDNPNTVTQQVVQPPQTVSTNADDEEGSTEYETDSEAETETTVNPQSAKQRDDLMIDDPNVIQNGTETTDTIENAQEKTQIANSEEATPQVEGRQSEASGNTEYETETEANEDSKSRIDEVNEGQTGSQAILSQVDDSSPAVESQGKQVKISSTVENDQNPINDNDKQEGGSQELQTEQIAYTQAAEITQGAEDKQEEEQSSRATENLTNTAGNEQDDGTLLQTDTCTEQGVEQEVQHCKERGNTPDSLDGDAEQKKQDPTGADANTEIIDRNDAQNEEDDKQPETVQKESELIQSSNKEVKEQPIHEEIEPGVAGKSEGSAGDSSNIDAPGGINEPEDAPEESDKAKQSTVAAVEQSSSDEPANESTLDKGTDQKSDIHKAVDSKVDGLDGEANEAESASQVNLTTSTNGHTAGVGLQEDNSGNQNIEQEINVNVSQEEGPDTTKEGGRNLESKLQDDITNGGPSEETLNDKSAEEDIDQQGTEKDTTPKPLEDTGTTQENIIESDTPNKVYNTKPSENEEPSAEEDSKQHISEETTPNTLETQAEDAGNIDDDRIEATEMNKDDNHSVHSGVLEQEENNIQVSKDKESIGESENDKREEPKADDQKNIAPNDGEQIIQQDSVEGSNKELDTTRIGSRGDVDDRKTVTSNGDRNNEKVDTREKISKDVSGQEDNGVEIKKSQASIKSMVPDQNTESEETYAADKVKDEPEINDKEGETEPAQLENKPINEVPKLNDGEQIFKSVNEDIETRAGNEDAYDGKMDDQIEQTNEELEANESTVSLKDSNAATNTNEIEQEQQKNTEEVNSISRDTEKAEDAFSVKSKSSALENGEQDKQIASETQEMNPAQSRRSSHSFVEEPKDGSRKSSVSSDELSVQKLENPDKNTTSAQNSRKTSAVSAADTEKSKKDANSLSSSGSRPQSAVSEKQSRVSSANSVSQLSVGEKRGQILEVQQQDDVHKEDSSANNETKSKQEEENKTNNEKATKINDQTQSLHEQKDNINHKDSERKVVKIKDIPDKKQVIISNQEPRKPSRDITPRKSHQRPPVNKPATVPKRMAKADELQTKTQQEKTPSPPKQSFRPRPTNKPKATLTPKNNDEKSHPTKKSPASPQQKDGKKWAISRPKPAKFSSTANKTKGDGKRQKDRYRSRSSSDLDNKKGTRNKARSPPIKSAPPRRPYSDTGKGKKSGSQTDRSDNGKKKGGETPRSGRAVQKEYFKEELKRLRSSLQKEADKIKAPEQRDYTPYCFNSLKPYYDTNAAKFIIEMPDEVRHGYVSRNTAVGLCDPWVDHRMDLDLLPKIDSRSARAEEVKPKSKKKNGERPPKEGSTRLPKFPAIKVPAGDLATKTLYYSDVPMLREELKKKYTNNADGKINEEYQRTKKDFYRMELDRMKEYHPISRPNMRKAYFAYLQNNPGSRKAVYECVKAIEKEEEEETAENEKDADQKSVRSSKRDNASMRSSQSQQQIAA